jgi:hypothetical protein
VSPLSIGSSSREALITNMSNSKKMPPGARNWNVEAEVQLHAVGNDQLMHPSPHLAVATSGPEPSLSSAFISRLCKSLDQRLELLIEGPESKIEASVVKCLQESFLTLSPVRKVEPYLSLIRQLRLRHPDGVSKRPNKRKAVVESIAEEFCRIHETQEREHEAQERDWWKEVATHPIASVVEKLRKVPDEHIEKVLDRLLGGIHETDSHILHEEVHRFLNKNHQHLRQSRVAAAPVIVAHISRLAGNCDFEKARELLKLFPDADRSALAGVIHYLRFVTRETKDTPMFSDTTYFSKLSEKDMFLSACYYYNPSAPLQDTKVPAAWPTLERQSQWDYKSIKQAFSEAGTKALNHFKVRGLQPRIAELAFRGVYGKLHGSDAERKLRDRNLERVPCLHAGCMIALRPILPGADWIDDDRRQEYDVKSNLYWRTEKTKERSGLSGFFLGSKTRDRSFSEIPNCSFPGIIFTGSDHESSTWIYIGEYRPIPSMQQRIGKRVLPFFFRLPDSCRYKALEVVDCDLGMRLLEDRSLRLGWQLALGMRG